MGQEKYFGCKVLKKLDDAKTPEKDIRKAIENGDIAAEVHENCPFSCFWKLRVYIESLDDPKFLIQDIVKEGERKVREENYIKALRKTIMAVQNLDDSNEPIPTETIKAISKTIMALQDLDDSNEHIPTETKGKLEGDYSDLYMQIIKTTEELSPKGKVKLDSFR